MLGREVLINIEIKTPKTKEVDDMYDSERLIKVLFEELHTVYNPEKFSDPALQAARYSFLTSFNYDLIRQFQKHEDENLSGHQEKINVLYLHDLTREETLPEEAVTRTWGQGSNKQCEKITSDTID